MRDKLLKININRQKGFAALVLTFILLFVMGIVVFGFGLLLLNELKIGSNFRESLKSYYAAEAGIEDGVYRIIVGKQYEATNTLAVGEGSASVSISSQGDFKVVRSSGLVRQMIRKLEARVQTEITGVAFYYGAQIDKGGLTIGANASVLGNVYSNGSMNGQGKGSGSKITGDAWVAGAVAPDPDQSWTTQNSDFEFGLKKDNVYYLDTAQSFVSSMSKVLNRVSLYLKKVGSPPDETVRIVADDGGQPSKTSLGSGTLVVSKITSSYSWVDVSLDSPPNLIVGTPYWIVVDVSRDDNNYWVWGKDSADGYLAGTGKYTRDWDSPGASWTNVGGDLNFKTWMGGETPTYINRVWVGTDAHANTITDAWIDRDAYYQTIDAQTTVLGVKYPNSADPVPKDLPISYAQIQDWEQAAQAGGVITPPGGTYAPAQGSSLGPVKIEGNLTFPSNSTDNPVIITGPVWVTGKISANNNSGIKLQTGLSSGYPVIADNPSDQVNGGKVEFNNNVITQDSPQGGKLLFISTNKSLDTANPAIWLYNNVNKDKAQSIIFSLYGLIKIENNARFIEVTGYAIRLENNAEITYEQGLASASFSSGPSGGLEIVSWKEIE